MAFAKKIDQAKAIKQRLKGMTYQAIADDQGVAKPSVYNSIAPILKQLANPETVDYYRKEQAQILDGLAARTVAAITNEDLEKAGLRDKVVAAGILIDKSRLVSGQSTMNALVIHAEAARAASESWGDGHVGSAEVVDAD